MDRVCDNRKRDPEPFETNDKKTGYFFVVPKDGDPTFLMSNMEFAFGVCLNRNPPNDDKNDLICINCMEAINGEEK